MSLPTSYLHPSSAARGTSGSRISSVAGSRAGSRSNSVDTAASAQSRRHTAPPPPMNVSALHSTSAPSTARRSQPSNHNTLHFDANTTAGSHRSVSQQSHRPRSRSHSQDLGHHHQQPHHPHPTHVAGTTAHQHHPRHTNYRGFTRCKYCNAFIVDEALTVALHEEECTFRPLPCELVDSETGERCPVMARGPQLLERHHKRCPMRLVPCSNHACDKHVSMQSLGQHLATCSQELVRCVACAAPHPRNAEQLHELHCPEMIVRCPLSCGKEMRRGDVPHHVRENLLQHRPHAVYSNDETSATGHPADSPDVVIAILLQRLHEQNNHIVELNAAAKLHPTAAAASSSGASRSGRNRSNSGKHSEPPSQASTPPPQQQQPPPAASSSTAAADQPGGDEGETPRQDTSTPPRSAADQFVVVSPFSPADNRDGGQRSSSCNTGGGANGASGSPGHSPGGACNTTSTVSRTLFAALATAKEVAQLAVEPDLDKRIVRVTDATKTLLEALKAHANKAAIKGNADVATGRATVQHLRDEADGAVQRGRRLWALCGLPANPQGTSEQETHAALRSLRGLAVQVDRAALAMRCAIYDCL